MRSPKFVRRVVPLALGASVITGTGLAWAHSGDGGPGYRTATVELGDVTQVVTATGTVSGLDTGTAAFGVAGLVDEVKVAAGDTVKAGDVLARMDSAALDAAVNAAEATLAKAKADLESAEQALADAEDATEEEADTPDSGSTGSSEERPDSNASPTPGGGTQTPGVDLTAPTRALNDARTAATVALDAATVALGAQSTACAEVLTPAEQADDPAEATDQTEALRECADAVAAVSAAQTQVATAQAGVAAAEAAYRAAMDQAFAAATARAKASEEATKLAQAAAEAAKKQLAAVQQTDGGQAPTSRGSGGSTSMLDLNAKVTVEEAAVRVAEAELEAAKADLDAAVLRAPIGGTVAEVPFTEGKNASADDAVSILGDGAMQVKLSVPSTTVSKLKKGMTAAVTSDGAAGPSEASVTAIGILPDSSQGTTTYPVLITVPNPSKGLADGAAASVAITLRSVQDVTTVPNSAVSATGNGSTASVTLLRDGKPVRTPVTTGAVGNTTTEITQGLTEGQVVVLADPSSPAPTSSTSSTRTGGFGGGGFGGGGFGGGGFGGGNAVTLRRG